MGQPTVVALILIAAAGAALVARAAFGLGGGRGLALLGGGLAALAVLNLVLPAFSDAARVASGAAVGFVIGTVVGVVRYGVPRRRPPSDAGRYPDAPLDR